jgi:hypothetical protein
MGATPNGAFHQPTGSFRRKEKGTVQPQVSIDEIPYKSVSMTGFYTWMG